MTPSKQKSNLGKTQQKILLVLLGGLALGMTRSPKYQYRIVRGMIEGWREIDGTLQKDPRAVSYKQRALGGKHVNRTVDSLYKSKLVKKKQHKDGTVTLVLTDEGHKRALRYHLDTITVPKQKKWDGKWRVVMYDVPEEKRGLRLELCSKLKSLGFVEMQQSVFVHPYECADEIEFLIEAYDAREYVRRMLVAEIDISEPLKKQFAKEVGYVKKK